MHTVKWFQVFLSNINIKGLNISFWPIDGTLTNTTTPGQNRPGSNDVHGMLHIPQSSKTGASPSDNLMSYPGHSLEESYPSTEMQLAYSTIPANRNVVRSCSSICNHLLHKYFKEKGNFSFMRTWEGLKNASIKIFH